MIPTRTGTKLIVLIAATLALGACGKQAPPPAAPSPPPPAAPAPAPTAAPAPAPAEAAGTKVLAFVLGTAVDSAGRLASPQTSVFKPSDTIYAIVTTTKSGTTPVTIAAHWTFQGTTPVNDGSQTVTADGESVTTFHIEKASGFPAGKYSVALSVDGKQVDAKDFEVK